MKLQLMVADGVHKGKTIPIAGAEFVIGRDPACQLRPSSPAISKKHCAIHVRDGAVFFEDFGSTNGSFVNGERVEGERQVRDQDKLKAGPLEFVLLVQAAAAVAPPAPAAKAAPAKPAATRGAGTASAEDESLAALLLADDDGPGGIGVPDGSTVMEMPVLNPDPNQPTEPKKDSPKKATFADSSSAAAEILKRYQKRPRT